MIIVNDRKTLMVFSDALSEINIHSSGQKILANFCNPMQKDIILAEYDNKHKAERAFMILANEIATGNEYYEMPDNFDERLNTTLNKNCVQRKIYTTGKTK